jgi:hypothetical protein
MSRSDTYASCEDLDTRTFAIERAITGDETSRAFNRCTAAAPCWTERSSFRSAPETRTKPCRFGGSGSREETNVAWMRGSNRADGPTIHACGSDAGEEGPVVGWIAAHPRSLALSMVEHANLRG